MPVGGYRDALGTKIYRKKGYYWTSKPTEIDKEAFPFLDDKGLEKLKKMNLGKFAYCILLTSKDTKFAAESTPLLIYYPSC